MPKNLVRRTFSGSDSWTVPAGVTQVKAQVFRLNVQQVGACGSGVVSGSAHLITANGDLYGWGNNSDGEVGDNTTSNRSSPTLVVGGLKWIQVGCGGNSTNKGLVLNADGSASAYSWGFNSDGRLGDNSATNRSSPTLVVGGLNLRQNAGSGQGGIVLTVAGAAYGWSGSNSVGHVGDNTTTNRSSPVAVVGGLVFKSVGAGAQHAFGIDTSDNLYGWGDNSSGQVGDNTITNRSSPVAIVGGLKFSKVYGSTQGTGYSLGITTSGDLYAWGDNATGNLGDNSTTSRSSPVLVVGGRKWIYAAAGQNHSLAVDSTGALYAWGSNASGQLGDGTTTNRSSPVAVLGGLTWVQAACGGGGGYSIALTSTGDVYGWGRNNEGAVGDNTTTNRSSPVQVVGPFAANQATDIFLNETYIQVTPGTSYTAKVLTQLAQLGANVAGLSQGLTKIVLEYYA